MRKSLLLLCLLAVPCSASAASTPSDATIRGWLAEMKEAPRGPFAHIRWFCKDGQILEPKPFACEEFGGGVQHGEWSDRTKAIRAAGFPIANVLADLKPDDIVPARGDDSKFLFLLLEKFMVAYDDGWILRKALFYRGAFQTHNEWESAKAILEALSKRDAWLKERYALLIEATRLLPHGAESQSLLTRIRGTSSLIAEQQPAFAEIRNKIHIAPDAGDAARVRDFAAKNGIKELTETYEQLAANIDAAYGDNDVLRRLDALIKQLGNRELGKELSGLRQAIAAASGAEERVTLFGILAATLRNQMGQIPGTSRRLLALDTAVAASTAQFTAGSELRQALGKQSRSQHLDWLQAQAQGLYGMGLLSKRELQQIQRSVKTLQQPGLTLAEYRRELELLGRVPGWASRGLESQMGDTIKTFQRIEPKVVMYVADRLRGSPMLLYALIHETLSQDANRLAGVEHSLFGNPVPAGLRALNPGLARGTLRHASELGKAHTDPEKEIYLVPETTPDLPAVAGILTEAEGNALSHVQLLARNLGVPNVVVGEQSLPALVSRMGEKIIVAASPGGVVRIVSDNGSLDALFADGDNQPAPIRVNLDKLDLKTRDLLPTTRLTAQDSGRSVGPKAAHVGELAHRFPGHVAPGLAIPFGVYREVLSKPAYRSGPSMFDWIRSQLLMLNQKRSKDPAGHPARLRDFLSRVRGWFETYEFDDEFRDRLQDAMAAVFGEPGSYGVFVRSDTNIEDLEGFTGAGLNKTVPNVVDFDALLEAIKQVWASPFSERAYSWRQGQMDKPEHVYVSILLHRSVPVDKSGVMVTSDVETGSRDWVTIVASPGVGGGVDGQAAEEVRVRLSDGKARLLATATETRKRILNETGGVSVVPAAKVDRLLSREELRTLALFARSLPERYPPIVGEDSKPVPADIEYGFLGDKLMLFQIRPFVQSSWQGYSDYLASMDAVLNSNADLKVDMNGKPQR